MAYPDVMPFLEEGRAPRPPRGAGPAVREPGRRRQPAAAGRGRRPPGARRRAVRQPVVGPPHDGREDGPRPRDRRGVLRRPRPGADAEGRRPRSTVMAARLAADTGDDVLQRWDWRYYDTELRKTEHGLDPHEIAAYFPLGQVLDGLLTITGEVFGLEYRRLDDVPVWHPDVRSYAIVDVATGADIAVAHMDLHPREGKFSHAAAFDLVPGRRRPDGTYRTPVSCIVANFTKPTAERPSLLTHDEVVTFFHEFGHVLHQTLTKAETVRFSGTSTEGDFVEAPSQIMEHWCWRAEVLGPLRPAPRDGRADPDRARRPARRRARPQRRHRQPAPDPVRPARHGPARSPPPRGRHDRRRRPGPRRHPAAGRGRGPAPAPRRHVLPGQLRPPPVGLRRRLLRLPVVEGVRRRHVQPLRRRRRHRPRRRRRRTARRSSSAAARWTPTRCSSSSSAGRRTTRRSSRSWGSSAVADDADIGVGPPGDPS